MTKLTENERKALNNACARLRETNLGTKIGNIEDFLDIDILKTDANTVSKAIDELFDKWANPLLNITVPPPGFFTLAGDAEGNLWCYCNDETNPPVFEHDETTGDLYLNIASEDGANSYQVHVGNYIAVKHLNDYYKKTEVDSKLGGKSNVGHNHDERYYTETEIDSKLNNKANTNHNHQDSNVSVTTSNYGSNLTQETFNSYISNDMILLKSKIDSLVGFIAKVVSELPATGENGVMYLKLNTSASVEGNIYDEYIWVNNKFEKIGSTETTVDLSGYVTQTEMNTQLANKAKINHGHLSRDIEINPDVEDGMWTVEYGLNRQTDVNCYVYDHEKKLENIDDGANKTVVDSSLSSSSKNPVQNKVVNSALNGKSNTNHTHDIASLPDETDMLGHMENDFYTALDTKANKTTATTSANGLMSKEDKSKLDGIATEANKTVVDSSLSSSSTNPVQNKIVTDALNGKADSNHTHDYIPSTISETVFSNVDGSGKIRGIRQGNVVTLMLEFTGEFPDVWKEWVKITDSQYLPNIGVGTVDYTDFGISSSHGAHMLLRINSDGRVRTGYGANKTSSCYQTITFLN